MVGVAGWSPRSGFKVGGQKEAKKFEQKEAKVTKGQGSGIPRWSFDKFRFDRVTLGSVPLVLSAAGHRGSARMLQRVLPTPQSGFKVDRPNRFAQVVIHSCAEAFLALSLHGVSGHGDDV